MSRCKPSTSACGISGLGPNNDTTPAISGSIQNAINDHYQAQANKAYYANKRIVTVPGRYADGSRVRYDCDGNPIAVAHDVVVSRRTLRRPDPCCPEPIGRTGPTIVTVSAPRRGRRRNSCSSSSSSSSETCSSSDGEDVLYDLNGVAVGRSRGRGRGRRRRRRHSRSSSSSSSSCSPPRSRVSGAGGAVVIETSYGSSRRGRSRHRRRGSDCCSSSSSSSSSSSDSEDCTPVNRGTYTLATLNGRDCSTNGLPQELLEEEQVPIEGQRRRRRKRRGRCGSRSRSRSPSRTTRLGSATVVETSGLGCIGRAPRRPRNDCSSSSSSSSSSCSPSPTRRRRNRGRKRVTFTTTSTAVGDGLAALPPIGTCRGRPAVVVGGERYGGRSKRHGGLGSSSKGKGKCCRKGPPVDGLNIGETNVGQVVCSSNGRPGVQPGDGTPTVLRGNRKVLVKDRHGCLKLVNNDDDRFGDSEDECNPCPDVTDIIDPEADEVCEDQLDCDNPPNGNGVGGVVSSASAVVRASGDILGDAGRTASAYTGVAVDGGRGRCGDRCYPEVNPTPDLPRQHCQQVTRVAPSRVTVCSSLQGPRLDPYPAVPRPYRELYANAYGSFAVGLASCPAGNVDYAYFSDPDADFVANDGSIYISAERGLILDASKFTVTYPPASAGSNVTFSPLGYLDRFKTWVNHASQHAFPPCGMLMYEACMAAATTNTNPDLSHETGDNAPPAEYRFDAGYITEPESDPRVACSGPTLTTDDGHQIMWGITSGAAYAIWQYLPFDRAASVTLTGGLRSSFVGAKYIKKNSATAPLNEVHRYTLGYDKHKRTAHWILDGVEVHRISDLGTPPNPDNTMALLAGERAKPAMNFARHGFGHFTFIDNQAAEQSTITGQNVALARLSSDTYFFPLIPPNEGGSRVLSGFATSSTTLPVGARIYGQGARAEIQEVKVYWAR
ncbi:hypothetical protein [Mollivirus kamchatka]|nr:hypothetical protein [Mollivirus kamchatka]